MKEQILSALHLKTCCVIKGATISESPGNSHVMALKEAIDYPFLIECLSDFSKLSGKERVISIFDMKFGLNSVEINGSEPPDEQLHVHLSHIIAFIAKGSGILRHKTADGIEHQTNAEKGDVVIVPRSAPHYFTGSPSLTYVGIEFGDVIDYQKHHLRDIEGEN